MKCLRCGYCCLHLSVVIVNDPDMGIAEGNLIFHEGKGLPCKHLRGNKSGEYSCAIHSRPWYKETPCWQHNQIESSVDKPCRMGVYILEVFLYEPKYPVKRLKGNYFEEKGDNKECPRNW